MSLPIEEIKRKALAAVDEEQVTDLLKKLLTIPSLSEEETPVALFLADYFRQHGLEVELQEVEPGRNQAIGYLRGTGGGPSLMLNGHTDVDPVKEGHRYDPWRPTVVGDRIYGQGAYNMKGGLAALIGAACAIKRAGLKLRGTIILANVVGELQGGVGTSYCLAHGVRPDCAVVAEPFGAHNVGTVHTGDTKFAIHTIGLSQHTMRREQCIDALEKMMKVLERIYQVKFHYVPRADLPGLPRVNVGAIIGGRGRHHELRGVPHSIDFCTILVDVRFLPSQSVESVMADLREMLEEIKSTDKDFKYELVHPPEKEFRAWRLAMPPFEVPVDLPIVQTVKRNYEFVTGRPPQIVGAVLPNAYSGDDTGHIWKEGIPCCVYGPRGAWDMPHPDQYIGMEELMLATKVLAAVACEVCA